MRKIGFASWAIFILLCIIWGSSFILMQWSSEGLTASQIASLRIFSAGIVMLPFAVFHMTRIPSGKIFLVILSAVCGNLLPAFLFAGAIAGNIDSSLAGILNSLTPICVVVIGTLFFRDQIGTRKVLGVLIGFAGLVLLSLSGSNGISTERIGYAFWILAATILYGLNVNLVSHYLRDVNPFHIATVSLSFMVLPTLLILWNQDFFPLLSEFNFKLDEPSGIRWPIMASIILGVVASAIATALFYILVQRSGGLFASLVTYGIPFVAVGWGLIYGENVTWIQVLCLGVILTGVYMANKK